MRNYFGLKLWIRYYFDLKLLIRNYFDLFLWILTFFDLTLWNRLRSHSHWALSDGVSISDAKNFTKEWVEYPFLVMAANANIIANVQCERTLRPTSD